MKRTRLVAAVCAVLVTAGCGLPMQSSPQPLPSNLLPAPLPVPAPASSTAPSPDASVTPTPTPTPTPAPAQLRLWFVVDDGLAAAQSDLSSRSGPQDVLEALAAGPDATQAAAGLRTIARDPLTGLPLVSLAAIPPVDVADGASSSPSASTQPTFGPTPAAVSVRVSSAFTALPPAEQVLLLGQVVLSLSGAGFRSVSFVDEAGASLAVPLPDGRLLDVPATARDYAPLITQP